MYFDDTIAAISTPSGKGGISIIRISGRDALEVADKIYKNEYGKTLSGVKSHTIHHGYAVKGDGTTIDEVLVSVMREPHTYTEQNVAEINCHE